MNGKGQQREVDAAAQRGSAAGATAHDVLVLVIGLATGFFWHLYNSAAPELNEPRNIIIGLVIILGFMVRYLVLWRGKRAADEQAIGMVFFQELGVFGLGLLLGLFWYAFSARDDSMEVHVIIALLVTIFALSRYLYLMRMGMRGGE